MKVLSDRPCSLGEGPTYDPATGTLYWFDIVEKKLLEKRLPDGEVVVHDLPVMASALAVIDDRRQMLVTERGLELRDIATGRLTLHKAVEADNPLTRSNDCRVHPSGAFWFSTMRMQEELGALGSIYWYKAGEVRTLFTPIAIPNSICFSPDGDVAYFVDSAKNHLMRVECDPATGLPAGEPRLFYDGSGEPGGIDGSVVDAKGILWNAHWGKACVEAFAPDGKLLKTIAVPAVQSSCPAFIGKRAQHMAVTSARKGLSEAALATDPKAGWTFMLDAEFEGRFDPPVDL